MRKFKETLLIVLVISALTLFGQREKGREQFEKIKNKKFVTQFAWGDYKTPSDYGIVPEKYMKEAAVFLKKEYYKNSRFVGGLLSPYNSSPYVNMKELSRVAIKIQSKQAITDFNILTFRGYDPKWVKIGIRVVKQNGTIANVDNNNFIHEKDEYGPYVKISIPNLEVGDILDYFKFTNWDNVIGGFTVFKPTEIYFVDDFPILHQHYEFILMHKTYMIFSSLNGAPLPNMKQVDETRITDLRKRIVFDDRMRDKVDLDSRWVYPLRTFPCLRYQFASGARSAETMSYYFFDKEDKATSKRSEADITKLIKDNYLKRKSNRRVKKRVELIESFIVRNKIESTLEKIEAAHNIVRRTTVNDFLPTISLYLKNHNIKHDFMYYVPRIIGDMDNVLARTDLQTGIRIHLDDGIYLTRNDDLTMLGETPYYFDGVDAFAYPIPLNKYEKPAKEIVKLNTPITQSIENAVVQNYNITLNKEELKVDYQRISSGKKKGYSQNNLPARLIQMEDDQYYKKIGGYENFEKEYNKLTNIDLKDTLDDSEVMKTYKSWIKRSIAFNYKKDDFNNLENVKLTSTGRFLKSPKFEIEASFILNNFIKKIGPNYLLNVGELIGPQIDITDEERVRKTPLYQDFLREYRHQIVINIPAGYQVEGLEKLNVTIENSSGIFKSEAFIENTQLIIKTIKAYSKLIDTKENWSNQLQILDAAFDFHEQKILLKKIE